MNAPLKVVEQDKLLRPREHEIWVRSHDDVHKIATQIQPMFNKHEFVDLACIGAACVNEGVKAVAVARELIQLEENGEDIEVQPFFSTFFDEHGRKRTRIVLRLSIVGPEV